jgi:uncharacterized protein (DUF1778 family)
MAREDRQLKLRLTDEMKALVTEAARANGRSVNAEIVHRLEQSFAERVSIRALPPAQPGEPVTARQGEVSAVVNELADALRVFLGAAVKNRTGEALSEEDMRILTDSLDNIVRPSTDKST